MIEETGIDKLANLTEQDVLSNLQSFWEKFQKPIGIGAAAILLIVGGWFGYNEYIKKPKEEKAAEALYPVQEFFKRDSSKLVIDGTGSIKGALSIIKNFGGTKAANLAHYYAGVSYLKLGDFNKAVEQLKDFSTDAKQIQMVAYGALADAYSELNKNEEAISYYKKAANTFVEDEGFAAEYLFRAGLLSEASNKKKEALEIYKTLKEKFPTSEKGRQIDKYIYRLNVEKNDFSAN